MDVIMENVTDFHAFDNVTSNLPSDDVQLGRNVSALHLDKLTFISDEQLALAKRIQSTIHYIAVLVIVPLIVCNVVVFFHRSMRSATGTYVIAISIGQLVHVLSQFIYTNIWPDAVDQPKAALAYCLYYWYVMIYLGVVIARRGSHIIMCMASVERLYAVVRPLHIKNFFLSKRPVLSVVITYSALAVWHVFYLVKHDITMVEMSDGEEICIVGLSAAYHTSRFVIDTFETISRVLFAYLSLVLQLMLNVLTVWGLRRHNMTTKHVQSSANEEAKRQKERQLTVTLMAATITYVSLALPAAIVNVVSTLVPEFGPRREYSNLYAVVKQTTYTLAAVGSGVDFFCYFGLSSNYRKTLLRYLRACTGKPVHEVNDISDTTQHSEY